MNDLKKESALPAGSFFMLSNMVDGRAYYSVILIFTDIRKKIKKKSLFS